MGGDGNLTTGSLPIQVMNYAGKCNPEKVMSINADALSDGTAVYIGIVQVNAIGW